MDIYNEEGIKTTYKFRDGTEEIFCNFDENRFNSEILLIEFNDTGLNNLEDNDYIQSEDVIYTSIRNSKVLFFRMKNSLHVDFCITLQRNINISTKNTELKNNLLKNLVRNKIEVNQKKNEFFIYSVEYNFGFTKLQLESGQVKFSRSNINYLEYLCNRFEDAIDIIINETE